MGAGGLDAACVASARLEIRQAQDDRPQYGSDGGAQVDPRMACPYIFATRLIGIYNAWDRIRHRAGLADVRLHDLRHSFASLLVNRGVSLYVVQGLLGHASPRMTQR